MKLNKNADTKILIVGLGLLMMRLSTARRTLFDKKEKP